ncbi:MAG: hypothetical protein FGM54_09875, partial [Chitinophagaceae bacterium]|nr:hypothetical protein [Chitinophagaceae bacterium]
VHPGRGQQAGVTHADPVVGREADREHRLDRTLADAQVGRVGNLTEVVAFALGTIGQHDAADARRQHGHCGGRAAPRSCNGDAIAGGRWLLRFVQLVGARSELGEHERAAGIGHHRAVHHPAQHIGSGQFNGHASNAVSPVGAVGPWQFMAGTAKHMGLRVDGRLDERRDFYKSTHAAAKYMKYLYEIFDDWLLVIASYNCGPAPVLRAINAGYGDSFWDIKARLPKETQNHVMAFIATTSYLDKQANPLAMGNVPKGARAPKADFSNLSTGFAMNEEASTTVENKPKFSKEELDQMATLKVKGAYKLDAISRVLDEDIVRLRRWNPDFDQSIIQANEPVKLRIPVQKLEQFIVSKDRIVAESKKG